MERFNRIRAGMSPQEVFAIVGLTPLTPNEETMMGSEWEPVAESPYEPPPSVPRRGDQWLWGNSSLTVIYCEERVVYCSVRRRVPAWEGAAWGHFYALRLRLGLY